MCLGLRQQKAREKFVITTFVEPRACDVEQLEARHQAREREGVDGELGNRFVGTGVGLIVEDMNGAVAHLQKIDVPVRWRGA